MKKSWCCFQAQIRRVCHSRCPGGWPNKELGGKDHSRESSVSVLGCLLHVGPVLVASELDQIDPAFC